MKDTIIFATSNKHKLNEVRKILAQLEIKVVALPRGLEAPEETGQTFVENSLLKARHYSKLTGEICLADDSGLVVPSLDGAPGIYSSRYAGASATDAENRQKLLETLGDIKKREAYFVCCLVCFFPKSPSLPLIAQGLWHGTIARQERGQNGFGYDSLFIPKGSDKTAAELPSQEKNAISHRGLALEKFVVEWGI